MESSMIFSTGSWGVLSAVLAAISFALWNIFLQRALEKGATPRQSMLSLAWSVACSFLPISLWQAWRGALPPLHWAGIGWYLAAGLMTAAVGPFLAAHATRRIGASRTVSLRLLDPFFALLIALLFLQEGLHLMSVAGIGMIVCALAVLQIDNRPASGSVRPGGLPAGLAFAIGASFIFTVGSVARKSGLLLIPSAMVAGAGEGLAGLLVLLPGLLSVRGRGELRRAFARSHADLWWSGLWGAAGTLFLNLALQRVSLPVAVTLRNTSPWFSLLLVPWLIGRQHRASRWVWISTGLLTLGMLLIVLR